MAVLACGYRRGAGRSRSLRRGGGVRLLRVKLVLRGPSNLFYPPAKGELWPGGGGMAVMARGLGLSTRLAPSLAR